MPPVPPYDLIIIGSGQAGNPLADAFHAAGKRVALIERADVGGTCVNTGCTPTKTMVASAEVASLANRAAEYGIHTAAVAADLKAIVARKQSLVDTSRQNNEKRFSQGIDLYRGTAAFTAPKAISVALTVGGFQALTADLLVIDTGLSSTTPNIPGIDTIPYLDNASIMQLDQLPAHLLILGGGYIGLEFAQMFRRFGSQVTVIQDSPRILPHEDPDITEAITQILRDDGITILLDTKATAIAATPTGLTLTCDNLQTLAATHLLVAAGRHPNTQALNLPAAGIATDPKGFIQVDDRLQTNIPGIYATGDVKGGPAFTHIAYDDYRILKANLLEGGSRTTTGRPVPYCVFIDPELGRIGLSETEAHKANIPYKLAKIPMSRVARAGETGQTRGFLKALVDPATHQILGAAILGAQGGEIMAMLQIAMMGRIPYPDLRDAIFAHPTYAESLNSLFTSLD